MLEGQAHELGTVRALKPHWLATSYLQPIYVQLAILYLLVPEPGYSVHFELGHCIFLECSLSLFVSLSHIISAHAPPPWWLLLQLLPGYYSVLMCRSLYQRRVLCIRAQLEDIQ